MTARERLIASYVRLVKAEKITIEQVPERYREDVAKALEE